MNRVAIIFAAAVAAIAGGGCETSPDVIEARRGVDSYMSGNFNRAIATLEPLSDKTDENYVLNNLRLGAAAMANYDFDAAESAYVRAYQIMNATKVNDAGREAATVWLTESSRVWRGEPYERAVANFQLGMIYYSRGDWNNARGAFENALFKLRDYKDAKAKDYDEQESDFAIALLMLGRTWAHLGRTDEATRHFDRAVQLRPGLEPIARSLGDLSNNVLLYVEYGFGPRKIEDGMDGARLAFAPLPYQAGMIPMPQVVVNGRPVDTRTVDEPLFDTLSMAADRRWQKIDTIRATKSGIGTGLMVAGAGATVYGANRRDEGMALAGIGAMAVGALLKASSSADTRVWEMTPRTAFVIPIRLPPGRHDVSVRFPTGLYQTWREIEVPGGGAETTFYLRMMRWTSGEYVWPPRRPAEPDEAANMHEAAAR